MSPDAFPYLTRLDVLYAFGEIIDVRKGLLHRPRAPEKTVILMVEAAGIVPRGDTITPLV
ncbi:hypothetical protein M3A49_18030 [Paraburkholderia sp. CNPSo 3076]|uniref:hypothetical protein n=1 Tax=Paraburkholderia sp. CNPSo 3076 TaxID=2940936 RepID=UPI002258CFF3|nr:hypothetical protein [Paraburkholderia sp. CNPSo 3076]MCX5541374.1 hypothetical protein [Paraburkholderia sp. CNPSo 3076]